MLGLKATMAVSNFAQQRHLRFGQLTVIAQVIDNSGALIAECVNVLKHKSNHGLARIGESTYFSGIYLYVS